MFNDWEIDGLSDFYFTLEQFKGVSTSVDVFYSLGKPRNAVLTQDGLMKRGLQLCSTCCLCGEEGDIINHLFLHCKITSQMWRILKNLKRTCVVMPGNTLETMDKLE